MLPPSRVALWVDGSCSSCDSTLDITIFAELWSFRNCIVFSVSQGLGKVKKFKMWKTFVILFCLSVALGVGYSATNGTTTATPTASNTSSTAKPPITRNLTTPSNKSSTTKPTATTKPTKGNSTTKPAPTTNSTTKPAPTTNSTTKPAPTTNSTTKPAPTTNSTTKPVPTTNSTTKPVPTTNSTTKPAPSTNSTTKPSNRTTSPPGSTTKAATTVSPTTPPPAYGNFSLKVKGENSTFCLLAQFAVTFTINYRANVTNGSSSEIMEKNGTIYLNRTNNKNVTIGGDCGSESADAKLVLTWPLKNSLYNLTMVFSKVTKGLEAESKNTKWRVKEIILKVRLVGNPDFKYATENNFTSTFNGSSAPTYDVDGTYDVGGYYSCNSKDGSLKFETNAKNYTVHPVFEDVRLEPFVKRNASDAFGSRKYQCYQDNPTNPPTSPTKSSGNDIVPIAVGCALAGLVLIVLIAYIIGRRKSHRGYEKV